MELRHLRYFIAVAEELNFTRAAKRVDTAQPSLSRQIQQLEGMIGGKLLIRTKKRVALTKCGHAFLAEAKQAVQQCESALNVARRAMEEESEEIRIAVSPVAELGLLPRLLPLLHKRFPRIRVSLRSLRFAHQVEAVREGNVQVGLCCLPDNDLGQALRRFATVEEIYSEPVVLAMPSGHPLSSAQAVALERIFDEENLVVPCPLRLSVSYDRLRNLAQSVGTMPRFVEEADNMTVALSMISAGLCLGFMPACSQSIAGFGVFYRSVDSPYQMPPVSFITPRNTQSAAVETLRQLAGEFANSPPYPMPEGTQPRVMASRGRRSLSA